MTMKNQNNNNKQKKLSLALQKNLQRRKAAEKANKNKV